MKMLVTVTGAVIEAYMDGYFIEERLLDQIMIRISDKGGGNLEIPFSERDRRYLSQFSAAQLVGWLQEAMLHVEAGRLLETHDGKAAWIADVVPPKTRLLVKAMRPARKESVLPDGLELLGRS